MKRLIFTLIFIAIFYLGCKKADNYENNDSNQNLYESNLAFINSEWIFDLTGDSLNDQIIGLWLSDEVSYNAAVCGDCDSLFTWVIESTGRMVKRNNDWGDHETIYGEWKIDIIEKIILFSYKIYANGGNGDISENFVIMTDSIQINDLSISNLGVSQFIDYPPTTAMEIKFSKLK
jgi:hypothetical protein